MSSDGEVAIVGGGIGGLTLALELEHRGIGCRVYEAAPAITATGVGINILPHAAKELSRLGLLDDLEAVAVATDQAVFFNRFGQHVYTEPLGRFAGYDFPQLSIHRGDLQSVLHDEVERRVGPVLTGMRALGVRTAPDDVVLELEAGGGVEEVSAPVVVGCDGVHSVIRRQLHPDEGPPKYSGYNMWRGVTVWEPILSGASMVRAGWLAGGKLVIYPIRDAVDSEGRQLANWVAEIAGPMRAERDWNRAGSVEDFVAAFADWHFDWLDVPAFLRATELVLEYPMVDQDPLEWWGRGRVTLLGDAAHPMVPRGSNGAGQAILDARCLADTLAADGLGEGALRTYEEQRIEATGRVVLANRTMPPDAILGEVYRRTGDRPFERIEDVISGAELTAITERYKEIAGYSRHMLAEEAAG
ncbi:MAG TPA: flavin-dependent oxidoreductase [Acidimicrobiales bacterium]|nr:flavin-dependent oxidoreductase [Acidimicrobiales bacterium]